VIRIDRCGADICLWIIAISPSAPAVTDVHNPDSSLRRRPLCGLTVGNGFKAEEDQAAAGGVLYDPRSGKTYQGEMKVAGSELHVRGYVGFSVFGETEIWKRPSKQVQACAASTSRP
jgi:uncharacterized protein (DUF2147 family)